MLKKHDLLVQRQVDITLPGGTKTAIRDFLIVDEQKLNGVPDNIYLEFRRSDILLFLHFHLMAGTVQRLVAEVVGAATVLIKGLAFEQ